VGLGWWGLVGFSVDLRFHVQTPSLRALIFTIIIIIQEHGWSCLLSGKFFEGVPA
jgi:hypothetical protein